MDNRGVAVEPEIVVSSSSAYHLSPRVRFWFLRARQEQHKSSAATVDSAGERLSLKYLNKISKRRRRREEGRYVQYCLSPCRYRG